MSTSTAARALPRTSTRPVARGRVDTAPTPRLRVVAPTPGRSRTGLAVASVALLVTGLLVLLMLNISISKGAYTLTELRRTQLQASEQQQALAEQVEDRSAPQRLAERARKMGMVPAPNTAFVRLSDGTVVGTAAQATAPPKPVRKKTSSVSTAKPSDPKKATAQQKAEQKQKKPAEKKAQRTSTPKRTTNP